jgi:hypothetical protein
MEEIKIEEFGVVDKDGKEVKNKLKKTVKKVWVTVKKVTDDIWQFCRDNKEEVAFYSSLAVTGIGAIKSLKSSKDRERERIDTTYYDPATGAHWRLRRALTNSERAELMARRRLGEYTEDILDDMRVLR